MLAKYYCKILAFLIPVVYAVGQKDCLPQEAYLYSRETISMCIDKCPFTTYLPDTTCSCQVDSNCAHLNAFCNQKSKTCECFPDFVHDYRYFSRDHGSCEQKNKQSGEACEFDYQCDMSYCDAIDSKCCSSYPYISVGKSGNVLTNTKHT